MTDWATLREQVLTRCAGYCELCGFGLNDTFALHHRKLRSRGGKDTLDNLIALHHECHNLGNNAVHTNIKRATETGHIVPRHAEPFDYPLVLPNGSIVKLTVDGSYLVEKEGYGW